MKRLHRHLPTVVLVVLTALGALGLEGVAVTERRYAAVTRSLAAFRASVFGVTPVRAGGVQVELDWRNPGPLPVELLEVQALAWQAGRYAGSASLDLRRAPPVIEPGESRRLLLHVGTAPPGETGDPWRFTLSGRLSVPILGAQGFRWEIRYPDSGGS